jgi:hypothetical protein
VNRNCGTYLTEDMPELMATAAAPGRATREPSGRPEEKIFHGNQVSGILVILPSALSGQDTEECSNVHFLGFVGGVLP